MKPVLAIIGAGKLGVTLAQRATLAGYTTYIAGSSDPENIALSVRILAPKAIPETVPGATAKASVIILALPLHQYRTLPAKALSGKIVIDAMNYWWEVDGSDSSLANTQTSTSELVQAFLKNSHVVKALSHVGYHHLYDEAKPKGEPGRIGVVAAGDSPEYTAVVAKIIDDFGYDPVVVRPLSKGKVLEPGNALFGAHVSADKIHTFLKQESID